MRLAPLTNGLETWVRHISLPVQHSYGCDDEESDGDSPGRMVVGNESVVVSEHSDDATLLADSSIVIMALVILIEKQ